MTDFKKMARELGEHVFRWGVSCEECTPEDFKIEMAKAVKQLNTALQRVHNEAIEKAAKVAEKYQMKAVWALHGPEIAEAIRQLREKK